MQSTRTRTLAIAGAITVAAAVLLALDSVVELSLGWSRVKVALVAVVASIGLSALLFVGFNYFLDLARARWSIFLAAAVGVIGALFFLVVAGNRLLGGLGLVGVLIGAGGGAGAGYLWSVNSEPRRRLTIGLGVGGGVGLITGLLVDDAFLPAFDVVALIVWPLVGAIAGFVIARILGSRRPYRTAVLLATAGWVLGAWLIPPFDGSRLEAVVAAVGVGLGLGAYGGLTSNLAAPSDRTRFSDRSKTVLFLTPALFLIAFTLIIPLVRTIYLSFLGTEAQLFGDLKWVGFEQYQRIFTDPEIVNLDNWRGIFGSSLFQFGAVLALVGIAIGIITGRQTGHRFEYSVGSLGSATVGAFFVSWAVFAALRGTVFNNLWWVVTVTVLATALGLAIAELADRAKYESLAKSLIFMPMAISFVGAGVIWRFMFIARPDGEEQTGVMNALWVALGQISNSDVGRLVFGAILVAILGALAYLAYRGIRAEARGVAGGAIAAALPVLFMLYRLLGPGLGGFIIENGEAVPNTIIFTQESPYNNVWLMVVLIWIQTGFAMVIFSAAIKAVPAELIEASRVDGATESQTFWRVTIPQIATTIGVVTTTLIVTVLKVFDIVKVMTNGNFDTQVIANEMWQRAFTEGNFGLGSALAVVLFIGILPIMYVNVRRMQRARAH